MPGRDVLVVVGTLEQPNNTALSAARAKPRPSRKWPITFGKSVMGNLFDEYPALLVLPELLLAIVILAAIVVMRRKPTRVRRYRHTRPIESDTIEPLDGRRPGASMRDAHEDRDNHTPPDAPR